MSKQPGQESMLAVTTNVAQAEHWNGPEGQHWADQHARYAAMLRPFGDRVLEAAAIQPGETVLDVGCGSGDLALAAAPTTGPTGDVVGIDLSVPMLDRARQRAADAGLGNVAFNAGDAQTHGFQGDLFDVVISRFGVMFFDDPGAAFTNLARVVVPGGRVAFVCWQDATFNEWMLVPSMAALAHVPPPDPAVFDTLSPFEFSDTDHVTNILHAAGFTNVASQAVEEPVLFGGPGTLSDAVEFFRDGSFGMALLTGAAPDQIERALAAVTAAFTDHLTPDGVRLGAAAWLVTATTPNSC